MIQVVRPTVTKKIVSCTVPCATPGLTSTETVARNASPAGSATASVVTSVPPAALRPSPISLATLGLVGSIRCGLLDTTTNAGLPSIDPLAATSPPRSRSLPVDRNGARFGFWLSALAFGLFKRSDGSISSKSFGTAMLTPRVLSFTTLKPGGVSLRDPDEPESDDRSDD